jgi:lipopolysaccharide transport system permease protein
MTLSVTKIFTVELNVLLAALFANREFIFSSIKNEWYSRFIRSKLGWLWIFINPLVQVVIYSLILSTVLATKLPSLDSKYAYSIYLMSGLLAWTLFSEITTRCMNLFVENGNLMKKVRFSRVTLPAIVAGSDLARNFLLFFFMAVIFLSLGHHLSVALLCVFPLAILLALFALGLGLVLGVLNVFVRDVSQVYPIVLQICFWFTPIVYPENIIPEGYRRWLDFNPMYHFTSAYQEVILYGQLPSAHGVLIVGALTLVLLLFSLILFRRSSKEMLDIL